jgi:DNA-binding transcriptional ArsR family regulator
MNPTFQDEINLLHSELCGALADPKRILILYALADKSMNVSELVQTLEFPQPTVSRHLKTLRQRGLVVATREAQSVFYALTDDRVIDALDILRDVLGELLESQRTLAQSMSHSKHSQGSTQEAN